jgi:hypothetical protein
MSRPGATAGQGGGRFIMCIGCRFLGITASSSQRPVNSSSSAAPILRLQPASADSEGCARLLVSIGTIIRFGDAGWPVEGIPLAE